MKLNFSFLLKTKRMIVEIQEYTSEEFIRAMSLAIPKEPIEIRLNGECVFYTNYACKETVYLRKTNMVSISLRSYPEIIAYGRVRINLLCQDMNEIEYIQAEELEMSVDEWNDWPDKDIPRNFSNIYALRLSDPHASAHMVDQNEYIHQWFCSVTYGGLVDYPEKRRKSDRMKRGLIRLYTILARL